LDARALIMVEERGGWSLIADFLANLSKHAETTAESDVEEPNCAPRRSSFIGGAKLGGTEPDAKGEAPPLARFAEIYPVSSPFADRTLNCAQSEIMSMSVPDDSAAFDNIGATDPSPQPDDERSIKQQILLLRQQRQAEAVAREAEELAKMRKVVEAAKAAEAAKMEEWRRQVQEAKARESAELEETRRRVEEAKARQAAEEEEWRRQTQEAKAREAAELEETRRRVHEAKARQATEEAEWRRQAQRAKDKEAAAVDTRRKDAQRLSVTKEDLKNGSKTATTPR